MWVFIPGGFVSIVKHRQRSGRVLVRARREADLEAFFDGHFMPPFAATPDADYPFRVDADQTEVAQLVAAHVQAIDYDNFKAAPGNEDRQLALIKVWMAMRELQEPQPAPSELPASSSRAWKGGHARG